MSIKIRAQLEELARNLYWIWNPEVTAIFRDLDSQTWRDVNHNPIEFLARISDKNLEKRATEMGIHPRITYAFHVLRDYLECKQTWGARYAGPLKAAPVAYFSAEFGLHESLPVYAGGLGVLAGDHLKAASDLNVPLVGVGLYYAKGYFHQRLDKNGWQSEEYFTSDLNTLPLKRILREDGSPLRVSVSTANRPNIWIEAWSALVGRSRLILLDTNVPDNSDDMRMLTSELYGGDHVTRIHQELVLGVGGMRVLDAMGIMPGVVHLNEGHSAFAVLELCRLMMIRDGQSFDNVREKAAGMTVFTTHTPVPAGHDRFDAGLVHSILGPLCTALGISDDAFMGLGRVNVHDAGEMFCMTVLGLKMSRYRNAVSDLHGRVSRAMWKGLWPNRAEHDVPIGFITNGVHGGTWMAAEMERLYRRCVGGHLAGTDHPDLWQAVEQIDDEEFWEQDQILKQQLLDFVRRRIKRQYAARGEADPYENGARPLDANILTIGFARRFAQYKRGDLLLRDLDRLDRLVNHPKRPIQFIFAGKAHPADENGKRIIQAIDRITRDPRFAGRIAFIEDYDINVGRHLYQGVDVWLNMPRRPLEACGTSGQKAVLNGVLNLSIRDGWWAEAYDGTNGFAVGNSSEHSNWDMQDKTDLESVFDVLENKVVPCFYDREPQTGIPRRWITMQKNALATLAWRFSAHRMVREYTLACYLPAAGGVTTSFSVEGSSHRF